MAKIIQVTVFFITFLLGIQIGLIIKSYQINKIVTKKTTNSSNAPKLYFNPPLSVENKAINTMLLIYSIEGVIDTISTDSSNPSLILKTNNALLGPYKLDK